MEQNAAAPADPDASQMSLVVSHPDQNKGQPYKLSANKLMSRLRDVADPSGPQIAGISQDGSRLITESPEAGPPNPNGSMPTRRDEIHLNDGAEALGLTVHSVTPPNVNRDETNKSHYLSTVVPTLATDDEKHRFISSHLKHKGGFDDPRVVGAGNDWYHYSDDDHAWYQIAKEPPSVLKHPTDPDAWSSLALEAPKTLASGFGMAAGAASGFAAGAGLASIPGAMAGGAAGGAAGSVAGNMGTKAALAAYDPDYRNALSGSEEAKSIGMGGLKDAAIGAVAGPLGNMAGPLVRGAGSVLSGAGRLASGLGGLASKEAVSEGIADMAPVVGNAKMLADIPEIGRAAVKAAPGLVGKIAESGPVKWLADKFGSEESRAAIAKAAGKLSGDSGSLADMGQTADAMMRQSRLLNMEKKALGEGRASLMPQEQGLQDANAAADTFGKHYGMSEEDIGALKGEMTKDFPGAISEENAYSGAGNHMDAGPLETAGEGWDTLAGIGQDISRSIKGMVQNSAKAVKGVGDAAKWAGSKAIPAGGILAQDYGLPQAGEKVRQYLMQKIEENRKRSLGQ